MGGENPYGLDDEVYIASYGFLGNIFSSQKLKHGDYNQLGTDADFKDNTMELIKVPHFTTAKLSDEWNMGGKTTLIEGPIELPLSGYTDGGRSWNRAVSSMQVRFTTPSDALMDDCCWGNELKREKCGPFTIDSDICKKRKNDYCNKEANMSTDNCRHYCLNNDDVPCESDNYTPPGNNDDPERKDKPDPNELLKNAPKSSNSNMFVIFFVFIFLIFISIIAITAFFFLG